MPVQRKSTQPGGITGANGQPHIELEIEGLKISSAPPAKGVAPKGAPAKAGPRSDEPASGDPAPET